MPTRPPAEILATLKRLYASRWGCDFEGLERGRQDEFYKIHQKTMARLDELFPGDVYRELMK